MTDFSIYTQSVIAAIGQNTSPRMKQAFPILIKHLHEAVSFFSSLLKYLRNANTSPYIILSIDY